MDGMHPLKCEPFCDTMKKLSFVAIDVETMTPELTSVCAVGLVKVVDGVITQKFYSLVRPIPDNRPERNTRIHGITDAMVENAPAWDELWPYISGFFTSRLVVCHNAGTDITALGRLNEYYGVDFCNYECIDTYQLTGQSLKEACCQREIPLEAHHDALCDATACAELLLAEEGIVHSYRPSDSLSIRHGGHGAPLVSLDYIEMSRVSHDTKMPLRADEVANKNTPFFQKKVVITGTLQAFPVREELAALLKRYGADINSSISKRTNIVIIGEGAGPKKMEKIYQLMDDGYEMQLFDEKHLLEIINKYHIE